MSIIFHRTAPACTEIYTLSLHDALPIWKSPTDKNGRGVPEPFEALLPYRWGFGVSAGNPLEEDLRETVEFLSSLTDRKSTRLNSSHTVISYAVFCLKKKKPLRPPLPRSP